MDKFMCIVRLKERIQIADCRMELLSYALLLNLTRWSAYCLVFAGARALEIRPSAPDDTFYLNVVGYVLKVLD